MNESGEAKPQWIIRKYQEGDEEQIRELRGVTLSGSRDSRWWQWMYKNGPDGPAIIWLAEANQKIVGQAALLPLRVKIGDQNGKGALGFDWMTHPDYQRLGILTKLRERIYESAVENGIFFSSGYSLAQIISIYKRQQSLEICEPTSLVKLISLGKVLKSRFGIPAIVGNLLGYAWELITGRVPSLHNTDIEVEQISSFDESIDDFWLKASELKKIMFIKDMKYLNWRYVEKPGNEYKIFLARRQRDIVGYIVIVLERKNIIRGSIIDILTLPHEDTVARVLIARAVGYLKDRGAAMISCLMVSDSSYYRILKKFGFVHRPSDLRFGIRIYDQTLPEDFITNPDNWHHVRGDTDAI